MCVADLIEMTTREGEALADPGSRLVMDGMMGRLVEILGWKIAEEKGEKSNGAKD